MQALRQADLSGIEEEDDEDDDEEDDDDDEDNEDDDNEDDKDDAEEEDEKPTITNVLHTFTQGEGKLPLELLQCCWRPSRDRRLERCCASRRSSCVRATWSSWTCRGVLGGCRRRRRRAAAGAPPAIVQQARPPEVSARTPAHTALAEVRHSSHAHPAPNA